MAELDPRAAYEFGRAMSRYCEAFNGQEWALSQMGNPDRANLAMALDHLTECAAMLMNVSERLHDAQPKPAEPSAGALPNDAERRALLAASDAVADWMGGGCDSKSIPRMHLALLHCFTKEAAAVQAHPSGALPELSGDEARRIARSVATSASDSPAPLEYVAAGWRAGLAAVQARVPQESAEELQLARSVKASHQFVTKRHDYYWRKIDRTLDELLRALAARSSQPPAAASQDLEPQGMSARAIELHEKAFMPWRDAQELAFEEASFTAEDLHEFVGERAQAVQVAGSNAWNCVIGNVFLAQWRFGDDTIGQEVRGVSSEMAAKASAAKINAALDGGVAAFGCAAELRPGGERRLCRGWCGLDQCPMTPVRALAAAPAAPVIPSPESAREALKRGVLVEAVARAIAFEDSGSTEGWEDCTDFAQAAIRVCDARNPPRCSYCHAATSTPAPAIPEDVKRDAERWRWLRDQHEGLEPLSYDAEGLPLPQEVRALAFTVFQPERGSLVPVGCIEGELDEAVDAAMAASGAQPEGGDRG